MVHSHAPSNYVLAAFFALLVAAPFSSPIALAQVHASVYASGLNHPDGMAMDHRGRLWVAQHGSGSDVDGCTSSALISMVTRSKTVIPVVESLPSCTVEGQPMGAHDVLFDERDRLFILQGAGFEALSMSLLGFEVDHRGRGPAGPPPFAGQNADIEVLASILPFITAELGTHESNPFRITRGPDGDQFIVDAAANAVLRRDRDTGDLSVFATFDNVANPLSPLGPPTIHPVPTGIAFAGDRFFVGSLTGFPFPEGAASIYEVDLDGNVAPLRTGLTTVSDLVIDPRDGAIIFTRMARFQLPGGFVPNSGGVFKLDLSNGSITPILENIDFPVGLAVGRPGELFVSLFTRGEILQVHSPSLNGEEIAAPGRMPSNIAARRVGFSLMQNTPNPFNPSTTIAFTLAGEADVRLNVYDLVGREVARPVDGRLGAGEHEIQFDASSLPTGVYLYRLDAGEFVATRRMIVLK